MYAGILIEEGDTQTLLNHPLHPYTVGLLQSIPSYQKRGEDLSTILGTVPALEVRSNTGCPFAQRCPHCMPLCKEKLPTFITEGERRVRCHLYSSSTKEELL